MVGIAGPAWGLSVVLFLVVVLFDDEVASTSWEDEYAPDK
jgi:hypothetical protein